MAGLAGPLWCGESSEEPCCGELTQSGVVQRSGQPARHCVVQLQQPVGTQRPATSSARSEPFLQSVLELPSASRQCCWWCLSLLVCWFSPFWAFLAFICCCAHISVQPWALPQPKCLCFAIKAVHSKYCIRFSLCFSPQSTSQGLGLLFNTLQGHSSLSANIHVLFHPSSASLLFPLPLPPWQWGAGQLLPCFAAPAFRYCCAPACPCRLSRPGKTTTTQAGSWSHPKIWQVYSKLTRLSLAADP